MYLWQDLTEDEHRELVDNVNALERKYVNLLRQSGVESEYSHIEYTPTTATIQPGPLPKYIPTKKPRIEEPKIVYGPPARFRPNREDCRSRTKRELNLISSIIELEGATKERLEKQADLIKELNILRSEYRKRRRSNKRNARQNHEG